MIWHNVVHNAMVVLGDTLETGRDSKCQSEKTD